MALSILICVCLTSLQIVSGQFLEIDANIPQPTLEGFRMQLSCQFDPLPPQFTAAWQKDNTILTVNGEKVANDQDDFVLNFNSEETVSQLTITSLQLSDSGSYVCAVYSGDPRFDGNLLKAESVSVSVKRTPNLICSVDTPIEVFIKLGENMRISCYSASFGYDIHTLNDLFWSNSDGNAVMQPTPPQFGVSDPWAVDLVITASQDFQTSNFSCQAVIFNRGVERCYVTMKIIWPDSIASIYPKQLTVHQSDNAEFECTSSAEGTLHQILWQSVPEISVSRFRISGNRVRIINSSLIDNNTMISCLIGSIGGRWLETSAVLYVREQITTPDNINPPPNSSSAGWIAAFVVLLILTIIAVCVLVFYIWKLKQRIINSTPSKEESNQDQQQPTYADLNQNGTEEYTGLKKQEYQDMSIGSRQNNSYQPSPVQGKRKQPNMKTTNAGMVEESEYVQPNKSADEDYYYNVSPNERKNVKTESVYEVSRDSVEEPEYIAIEP